LSYLLRVRRGRLGGGRGDTERVAQIAIIAVAAITAVVAAELVVPVL